MAPAPTRWAPLVTAPARDPQLTSHPWEALLLSPKPPFCRVELSRGFPLSTEPPHTPRVGEGDDGAGLQLESQNAALRVQNAKCSAQLELLASAARRSSLLLSSAAHVRPLYPNESTAAGPQ